MKNHLAVAMALLAAAPLAFSLPFDEAGAGGSVRGELLRVVYPGIPLARATPAGAPEPGPRVSAMDTVAIPGITPRNVFADRVHWLLGLATVMAGGITGFLGDEGDDGSLHHAMGYVSSGLAVATLATGYWAHRGDVGPSDGFSPANVHALLGIAGGLMMAVTPLVADLGDDGEAHAALGIGGEVLMGIAVAWPLVF